MNGNDTMKRDESIQTDSPASSLLVRSSIIISHSLCVGSYRFVRFCGYEEKRSVSASMCAYAVENFRKRSRWLRIQRNSLWYGENMAFRSHRLKVGNERDLWLSR